MNPPKRKSVTTLTKPVKGSLTPFAMANMSEDLHNSSLNYQPIKRFPLTNFFLYSVSIELGLKAAILSKGNTSERKELLKKIGHNLEGVLDRFEKELGVYLFTKADRVVISKVNFYYKNKSLEYFSIPYSKNKNPKEPRPSLIVSAMTGYSDFPTIEDFGNISQKIINFIIENEYFISA